MGTQFKHETVLLNEAVAALNVQPKGVYIDGTFGRGGHSAEILKGLGEDGHLLMIDQDPEAIKVARQRYQNDKRVKIWQGSFRHIPQALAEMELATKVDGVLLDLGVSSPQLDDASRGFSFAKEGDLDMRMNPEVGESAAQWLQHATAEEIADVLWQYGEERLSRRIASAIVMDREKTPFKTTLQLAEMIARVIPKREKNKHPATRSFQAIRIHINQELAALVDCLDSASDYLAMNARLVVISFHSLEDRLVKRFMRKQSRPAKLPKGLPVIPGDAEQPMLRLLGKAIKASVDEVKRNPRSRSAVMRIAERQN